MLRPGACCSGSGNYSHRLAFVKTSLAISTASDWEWLNLGCEFLKFEGSLAFHAFLPPPPQKPKQDIRILGCCPVRRCWTRLSSSQPGQFTGSRAARGKPLPRGRQPNKGAVWTRLLRLSLRPQRTSLTPAALNQSWALASVERVPGTQVMGLVPGQGTSTVGVQEEGNQWMLLSHVNVCVFLLSPCKPPSLKKGGRIN